ncbi:S9 family peptidase [Mucilaginibacter myungsuensis]|uniref:DPP IV N-terminal domain-containing protein n=1 Tax=Mucilaginibacter myungsuensis TaxID=649104 RepID=A0A929L2Y8_9SPHI|nr:DPP IV N-terminal domain-containing protein [Mucilaginibacter myungsuensis]MBE9664688.1 DPP IV N-terminal domain-containing protein [Mucilaginibacter myungsuensis]MDN3601455.1 DPP IV N-terminal domain-containing protein [Mucilaginibacter myungsuensis]
MKKLYLSLFALACIIKANAQTAPAVPAAAPAPVKGNYQLASRFSPKKISKMVFSMSVDPHWLKLSDRFWYTYETGEGRKWYIVDPAFKTKKQIFDNDKLAAAITLIVKDPFDAQHLPIENLKFTKDEKSVQFELKSTVDQVKKERKDKKAADSLEKKTFYFTYDLQSQKVTELKNYEKVKPKPSWASIAPDSSAVIFARKFNLYWMDKANYKKALKDENDSTIVEHQLTKDGIENYAYGNAQGNETNAEREKNAKKRQSTSVLWSPDSKHFAMTRTDQRKVKDFWVINSVAEPRPTLETYKYQMPGEKDGPVDDFLLFDFDAKTFKKLAVTAFKDQDVSMWSAPVLQKSRDDEFRPALWLGDNEKFYFYRIGRDLKKIDVCSVDIKTSTVKVLIQERMNTYVEIARPWLINGGKELIHWSERDGWAHFYLFDGAGKLKNQITTGSFHCDDVVNVDEKSRTLYFNAVGREANQNPYYSHLYKINLDGTGIKQLNPGDFTNTSSLNDNAKYFVNTASRVNAAPKSVLYNSSGTKIMDLETTDLKQMMAAGYKFPEPFKVKADDGITDLYGVMYKPYDFDPAKKYPIIEYVYPGPQTEAVNIAFSRSMDYTDRLAQMGFIVISVGNRGGNPSRSKWYHTFGYGNLRDYGLADKKAAAEQLADKYPFIDITRVGITGHSGGGFMSTAAMLVYPDFFKVAVSESGNHDNSIYNRWWSEKHHGVKEVISPKGDTTFTYSIDKNQDLAKNLKGRLMLSTGEIDNNVSPSNTVRVINALIKANKRFDYVLLPGQRHAYGDMTEYFFWQKADYFTKYLLGDFSQPVDIVEMSREVEMSNKRGGGATPDEEQN